MRGGSAGRMCGVAAGAMHPHPAGTTLGMLLATSFAGQAEVSD